MGGISWYATNREQDESQVNSSSLGHEIFHNSTACITSRPISARACFFALSVIPSSASISAGVVCSGSNSKTCPSFVGTTTIAAGVGSDIVGLGGVFGSASSDGDLVRFGTKAFVACELDRECVLWDVGTLAACELALECPCEPEPDAVRTMMLFVRLCVL